MLYHTDFMLLWSAQGWRFIWNYTEWPAN